MRAALPLCATVFLRLARSNDISPFYHAEFLNDAAAAADARLAKRQSSNCFSGFDSCVRLGAPGACCQPETVCSRDAANNIACCPTGAVCTGIVTAVPTAAPTTAGFRFPEPGTQTPTTIIPIITPPPAFTGSVVPGAAFPFVYIPTAFRDEVECLQSYTGCQSQFSQCTAVLAGMYGVTVGGNNGFGVTVQPLPTTQAQSVCSSLRDEACYGLQPGYCTAFGGRNGNPVVNPGAAAGTRSSALYEILTGLALALAGMIA